MKAYYAIGRLRFVNGLQYRAAALAGVATQFFWGFLYIMLFQAFYSQGVQDPPMSLEELTAYIWLQQALLAFIMLWFRDNDIFQLITGGNIAYELCRPLNLYGFWYAKLLAQRLSAALLRSVPILLVAFLLPRGYRMTPPPDAATLLVFLAVLFLGLLVLVAVSMFIYISVFWTMSPVGSLLLFGVIGEFFAGLVIPLPLMPAWLQQVADWLPFHLSADLPFRVYSGQIPLHGAFEGILAQLAWLAVLVGLGSHFMRRALRRVVVQGG